MATNTDVLVDPMLFYLAFARRADSYPSGQRQPLEHAADLREMTRVELISPHAQRASPELRAAVDANLLRLRAGAEYALEVGFDGELRGRRADFRPSLPLILCW